MNAALLALVVAAGIVGGVIARRSVAGAQGRGGDGEGTGVVTFLGCVAVASALLFGYGIILIAANPLVFEVCS